MTHSPDEPLSHAQAAFYAPAPFDVLDKCHQEILAMLDDLHTLIEHVATNGVDASARALSRSIHLFFTTTGLPHHLDEEQHVFPVLLKNGDPEMVGVIEHLRRDHVEIEAHWLSLVPHLHMIARGYKHPRVGEIQALAQRFNSLCRKHIEEEERLIYPRAKAGQTLQDLDAMRREMAERRGTLLNPGDVQDG